MTTYKVLRFFRDDEDLNGLVIKTGLTLEEAQAHCSDPETTSETATGRAERALTEKHGPWFDGFGKE